MKYKIQFRDTNKYITILHHEIRGLNSSSDTINYKLFTLQKARKIVKMRHDYSKNPVKYTIRTENYGV
jgi:hypothetical protein